MSQNLERLKRLLAEVFKLDQAELDFGIYRIMNTKREEIVRFLDRDLLPQIREAFQAYETENRGARLRRSWPRPLRRPRSSVSIPRRHRR